MVVVGLSIYTLVTWELPVYRYVSSDRGFEGVEIPWKGRHFGVVRSEFRDYKRENPDVVLLREFGRRWHIPSRWIDNFTHKRWHLPRAGKTTEKQ